MVSKVDESQVRARYEASGQDHVFKYIDLLSPTNDNDDVHERRTALLQQLDSIKVEDLGSLFQSAMADQQQQQQGDDNEDTPLGTITPFSKHVGKTTNIQETESAYEKGIDAIRNSEVAALVLAGGQGSRLGYDGPKGMYDIGLPSSRTLFQLLCERLHKLRQIATTSRTGRNSSFSSESDDNGPCLLPSIPFYIMTSPINHTETVQFFEANAYFGLPKEDVSLFEQGMLPCLTNEGKIIMETPTRVAMAPDG
jgi:UDP-N-acetylglucosamine/UDP-N-acetylgalactosamine diphosphorylase